MAMQPLPYTTFQSILVTAASIIGPLAAVFFVLHIGASWPLVAVSILVSVASLYGVYWARRAPFTYRLALRFVANLSLFSVIVSVFSLVRL
jgi:hypothetical protein